MKKKILITTLFITLSLTLSIMSNTYARYVAGATNKIETNFKTWQVLINDTDIVNKTESSVVFKPIMIEDENTKNNTLAPSSKGYFDIDIDPTNIGLSFRYILTIEANNELIPDLRINKYEILDETKMSNPDNTINITDNVITNTMLLDNINHFRHDLFTIRVYFEWYDEDDNLTDDEEDTTIGTTETEIELIANIKFEQIA